MRKIVARFPTVVFFALSYGISWSAWMPYVLSGNGFGVLPFRFPNILGSGQLLGIAPGAYVGPLGSAFLVTATTGGRAALRVWRDRLLRWRVGMRWYAFAFLGIPLLGLVSTLALPGAADLRAPSLAVVLMYLPALAVQVLTTGVAEEPGWRDFALPRLQERYGPLLGTVVLGSGWAGWHVPLFCTDWAHGAGVSTVPLFVAQCLAFSVVITWVFNRTGGSLPVVVLMHASSNNTISVLWRAMFPHVPPGSAFACHLIGYGSLAVLLLLATHSRLGYPARASRVAHPG